MNQDTNTAHDAAIARTSTTAPTAEVIIERTGNAGLITLNRPKALNALSLQMLHDITTTLAAWRDDPAVLLVAIRGSNKVGRPGTAEALFGNFCAGGDIRFFHQAALAGDPLLGDYFTQEYRLNRLIQTYPKPFFAFMDGVVMGGGMGLCQGDAHTAAQPGKIRVVTQHTKMAMPETNIGLFPDVGGGYFLSRCPGSVGEYLALTGEVIGAEAAITYFLADVQRDAASLPALWAALGQEALDCPAAVQHLIATEYIATPVLNATALADNDHIFKINSYFSLLRVKHIVDALEKAKDDKWAQKTAIALRKRSPLMLHVTLEQIRRARSMNRLDELRMERDMVHHCFELRPGATSETAEGIRALAVDKDYTPKWNPARIEDVKPGMADAFFASPWPDGLHPLRDMA